MRTHGLQAFRIVAAAAEGARMMRVYMIGFRELMMSGVGVQPLLAV
jgi:hypothetical protein